jgi:hypothetical protein
MVWGFAATGGMGNAFFALRGWGFVLGVESTTQTISVNFKKP